MTEGQDRTSEAVEESEEKLAFGIFREDTGEAAALSTGIMEHAEHVLNNVVKDKDNAAPEGWTLLQSYVDSGAARSVCPLSHGTQFGIQDTPGSLAKEAFITATGKRVPNQGGRIVKGRTSTGRNQWLIA